MKVSKKSRYGLRAMIDLALYNGAEAVSTRTISKDEDIPLQYLEQIFNRLKKAGLVKTARGPKGGYALARQPSKIKVKDIIGVLEDKDALVDCLADKKKACSRVAGCAARVFWDKLDRSIKEIMGSTTIQDLCAKAKKKKKPIRNNIEHSYLFQI